MNTQSNLTGPTLEERLDALSREVARIADYIREEQARQESQRDLMGDLEHILPEAMAALTEELQHLEGEVQLRNLIHLGRILRNVPNLIWLLEQLESLRDLLKDTQLILHEVVPALMETLDQLEKRQYFAFFQEALRILDNILKHYTPEDARLLADNIVLIVDTLRELTQPDVMTLLGNSPTPSERSQKSPRRWTFPYGTFSGCSGIPMSGGGF